MPSAERIGTSDWVKNSDPSSGRIYYANLKTKETSWKVPEEIRDLVGGSQTTGEWVEREDSKSKRKYYYNTVTRETSWTMPESMGGKKGEWKKRTDPKSSKVYYFNTATRETSWKKPAGYQEPDEESTTTAKADLDAAKSTGKLANLRDLATKSDRQEISTSSKVEVDEEADLSTYTLECYGETHFNLHRKGVLKQKSTVDKMLRWKADTMKMSLTKLSDDLSNEAVQVHKNITGYMGDRSSKKKPLDHIKKMLKGVLAQPSDKLSDETYCQLCKQTNLNPNPESCHKGWELIVMCLATFPPSSEFEPYLKNYVTSRLDDDDELVQQYAAYCLDRMPLSVKLGRRQENPTSLELDAIKDMKAVQIRVFFLDGTFKTVLFP